jgi:limonene-1,2-epoxide hydrolase
VTEPAQGPGGIIEDFFVALSARDWDAFARVLAPDVERIGPFGDRVRGRARYVDLLRGVVPSVYGNDVHRITCAPDGRSAFARVTEHLGYPDLELHLEEAYAFGLGDDGLISLVEIFMQSPDADPGGFGSASSGESYASSGGPGPDERPAGG